MNHEHDLLNRLVDYHDHIAAPSVHVTDDLHRGRRRVRRNRGLIAGGGAIGLASVVAVVSLVTGEPSADRLQPADPPGLITPLVLPESPLEVGELGFHVESAPDIAPNQDWNLAPDHQATTVEWVGHTLFVRVYYPGTVPDWQLSVEGGQIQEVSVHGVAGYFVEQFGKGTAAGDIDFSAGACGTPPRGCDFWQSELIWEFAPNSWASVYGFAGESPSPQAAIRPAFVQVAEAVRSGGGAITRVPFRVGTGLGPIPPLTEAGVGMKPVASMDLSPIGVEYPPGTRGWLVSFYGGILEFSVNSTLCSPNTEDTESTVQPFTYRGHKGCLHFYQGELSGVGLRVGGVDRVIWHLFRSDRMEAADLKSWLADLTVAPLDDPSTWFDLKSAFSD